MVMSRATGSNLFGLALGSSIGMMLFSLAYHSGHVMYVTNYEVYHFPLDANNVSSSFIDRHDDTLQTKTDKEEQGRSGERLYFQNDTAIHRGIKI